MRQKSLISRTGSIFLSAVAVLILLCSCTQESEDVPNSPEGVAQAYIESIFDGDTQQLLDLIPEQVMGQVEAEGGFSNKDDLKSGLEEQLQTALNTLDAFGITVDCQVGEVTPVEDISALQDDYQEIGVTVSDAKIVPVEINVTFTSTDLQNTQLKNVGTILIDGTWYLDISSIEEWSEMVPKG